MTILELIAELSSDKYGFVEVKRMKSDEPGLRALVVSVS